MLDGETFGLEIVEIVKSFVERTVAPLQEEIAQLKQRPPVFSQNERKTIVQMVAAALPPAKDGKDVDPEDVRAMVADAVAALPEPKPGRPGVDADPALIQQMVQEAVAALPPAKDGKDVDPEDVRAMVADAVAALPEPKPGRPGVDADPALIQQMVQEAVAALPPAKDGKDVDPEDVRAMVADAVAALPEPKPGRPGVDADPALIQQMVQEAVAALPPAKDGKDVDPEDVRAMVADAVALIPTPKDGYSITIDDVRPTIATAVAQAVGALPAAKDGVGLAGAIIDRTGALVLTLSDGTARELGPVVGKDADMAALSCQITDAVAAIPRPRDGFGFEDLVVDHDGERGFVLRFQRGDVVKEFAFSLPVVIDRGIFKEGASYQRGDAVTWAGSLWIAQRDATRKPGDGEDWRLSVKRGRDARPAG